MTSLRGNTSSPPKFAWGIDCGAHAAHLGMVSMDGKQTHMTSIKWPPMTNPGRRLIKARTVLYGATCRLMLEFPPCTIAVERPTGARRNPPLDHHAGVTVEAVGSATDLAPFWIAVTSWRAQIGLGGRADKAMVCEWAGLRGWTPDMAVDLAEALGIAWAARDLFSNDLEMAA